MHIYLQCLCHLGGFFKYYGVTFWVSLYGPFFEVYLVLYEYCYPCFFFLSICLENFFPVLHFQSLCFWSFVLRWVSCRQHMCGSCFLIHSAILCLLIGAFNPFTFKVIIDRYLFITDSLYLCSSLFLSFPSFPYSSPFSISCRAGLVEVYSFRLL